MITRFVFHTDPSLLPLKTTTFANLPRAILLTAFFFITRAFIAFMLFMVLFITDFFIGRAIVNLRRSSGIRGKTQEFARGLEPVQLKQHWKSQQISSLLFYLSPSKMRGWFYQNHKNPSVVFCGCTMDIVMFAFEVLLPSTG